MSTTLCGWVQGVEVNDILIDTGCTHTMVQEDLIQKDQMIEGEAATIRCVHGDNVLYPMANVTIDVEGFNLTVRAAVHKCCWERMCHNWDSCYRTILHEITLKE